MLLLTKKRLTIFIAITAAVLIFAGFFAETIYAKELELNYPKLPGLGELTSSTKLPDLINYLYTFAIMLGGLIAFGGIVFAGFLFMTSGANPGLRAKAKERLKQVILGVILLLASFLILNTINPELVLLAVPSVAPKIPGGNVPLVLSACSPTIALAGLKYGGVVMYEEPSTSGASGRSETILHDVANFEFASFIHDNLTISAIKILGPCQAKLGPSGFTFIGPWNDFLPFGVSNDVNSLTFTNKTCLGDSIKVFEKPDYNPTLHEGSRLFIHNNTDLPGVDYVDFPGGGHGDVDDKVRSVKFAQIDPLFTATFCEDPDSNGECISLTEDTPTIPGSLINKISTVSLCSGEGRQAGVVLYEHPDFKKGRQEIFIASDEELDDGGAGSGGNFLKHDHLSALKIIGKYKVTLYEHANFTGKWVSFDNTGPVPTYETVYFGALTTTGSLSRHRNILEIRDLDDKTRYCIDYKNADPDDVCNNTFNDELNSIKIEVPFSIVVDQNLIPAADRVPPRCIDTDTPPDGILDFCEL